MTVAHLVELGVCLGALGLAIYLLVLLAVTLTLG